MTKLTDAQLLDTLEAVVRSTIQKRTIPVVLGFTHVEWDRILAISRHGILLRLVNDTEVPNVKTIAEAMAGRGMQCTCDFDRWEPEFYSGHTFVCKIHKAAMREHARLAHNLKEG